MALFSINRFVGDEENDTTETPSKSKAQLILQKIHERAHKRKNSATDPNQTLESKVKTEFKEETPSPSQKDGKSKLRKRSLGKADAKTSEAEEDKVEDTKTEIVPVKKKRRKSKETSLELSEKSGTSTEEHEDEKGTEPVEGSKGDSGIDSGQDDSGNAEMDEGQSHRQIGGFTVIGDVKEKKIEKVQRVLPDWLAKPSIVKNNLRDRSAGIDAVKDLLDVDTLEKLKQNGITYLFPVQRLIIPVLLSHRECGHLTGPAGYRPSDICCSAPTGSGKTLAFVLPIVQVLKRRVVCHIRAMVVLPVRDLAMQVYRVFLKYCQGTDLKVGLIVGQKAFSREQMTLVKKTSRGPQSLVDIVVATPGRLVDHIKQTEGFNLHHLRFLVIDEADRMMDDIKQDWLTHVEQVVYDEERSAPGPLTAASACSVAVPFQKLLFSATLSQNPEKLEQLNLFQPQLFTSVVDGNHINKKGDEHSDSSLKKNSGEFAGKYTTPEGLAEFMIEAASPGDKPLLVLYLLHCRKYRHVLCFTNSVENTHRLYLLLKLFGGLEVREFSSNLHGEQRAKIVNKFAAGKIDVLICSDAMARGMDIENVECVISYDHAPFVKTYIHRIGRTARAGNTGTAISLLEGKEMFPFKKMVEDAGKPKVEKIVVTKKNLKQLVPEYQKALQKLPEVLEAEKKTKR